MTDYEREQAAAAKTMLRGLRGMSADIDALLERRMRYEAQATRVTASYSGMPHGGRTESSVEYFACKLADMEREMDERVDEYVGAVREIEKNIDALADDRHRKILRWRYVNWWDWERIATELGVPESTARGSLHQGALLQYTICCGIT